MTQSICTQDVFFKNTTKIVNDKNREKRKVKKIKHIPNEKDKNQNNMRAFDIYSLIRIIKIFGKLSKINDGKNEWYGKLEKILMNEKNKENVRISKIISSLENDKQSS